MSQTWTVILDPPSVATGRTPLNINELSLQVYQAGIDWGESEMQAYEAEQQVWGSTVIDGRWPNRMVTIPLLAGADDSDQSEFETALTQLRQKVALFQREGGWLKRNTAADVGMYADVVNASLVLPDVLGETGNVEPNISLVLECLPDFYGTPIVLDTLSGEGAITGVLTLGGAPAYIEGDHPGRAQITVSDASGNDQLGLLWGLRGRYYDPAPTAALSYQAELMTPLNGAMLTSLAGSSGAAALEQSDLPGGAWVSILLTDLLDGGPLTHVGSYGVWVRAYSPAATPALRLLWGVGGLAVPVSNPAVTLPGAGGLYLVNLGQVRVDPASVGVTQWSGAVQVMAQNAGDAIALDEVFLVPLDEGAGQLSYVPLPPASSVLTTMNTQTGTTFGGGTVPWVDPGALNGPTSFPSVSFPGGIGEEFSEYLNGTGCGFQIPSGATIQGIGVLISRYATGAIADAAVHMLKAGAVVGSSHAALGAWAQGPFESSYGGPSDLWGATWLPADINAGGFGVALEVTNVAPVASFALVYAIAVQVYYTLASGFTIAQDAVMYADQSAALRYDGCSRTDPTGSVYGPVSQVSGDLPRIPCSGMEGRSVQLFCKPSRGDLNVLPDSAPSDALTVTVSYRPSYIFRPTVDAPEPEPPPPVIEPVTPTSPPAPEPPPPVIS